MSDTDRNLDELILKYLPHRYPFLLVDRILELVPNEYIVGLKNVTINEPFFVGHFPGRPVMPGVLIIEAMAQVGGVMAYESVPEARNRLIYFMSLDKVKFRNPVLPGDSLIMKLENIHRGSRAWKMSGKAFVNDKLMVQAELTAAVGVDY